MKRGGIALYCSILDELPAGEALFVASDSPEALATVLQRYGARRIVVSTAASSIGSLTLREFEWALADILVMSRASRDPAGGRA